MKQSESRSRVRRGFHELQDIRLNSCIQPRVTPSFTAIEKMAVSSAIYPSLQDKVVVITGGAEGIGAAAVELFCKQGSKTIFFDISEPSAQALIDNVKNHRNADPNSKTTLPIFYQCDVIDLDQLKQVARRVLDEHGPVDVLVNNAAKAGASSRVPSDQVTPEGWELDINVNLRHVFFLTQAIIPAMQKKGSGSIINMGSISWRIPAVGTSVYMVR